MKPFYLWLYSPEKNTVEIRLLTSIEVVVMDEKENETNYPPNPKDGIYIQTCESCHISDVADGRKKIVSNDTNALVLIDFPAETVGVIVI